jgi:glyoxylase-like metal-dependent hydrolase (beta-lactamase superfamily II)
MLTINKISDNITLFSGTSFVNSVLIEFEKFLIVIDTMLLPKDSKELSLLIKKKNKPIKYILNTHWHSDHCYGNRFIKDENTLIIAHKRFLETITAEKNTLYPNHKKFINKSNFVLPNLTFSKQIVFNEKPKLHFIHFPGHSYDSSVIWLPQEKILIAGDNVLNSNNGKIAIPYFYWGNPELMLNSLLKIRNLKPNIILPGHGKPTDLKKLSIDILYLKNLLSRFNKMSNKLPNRTFFNIKEQDLIKNTSAENFWVPNIHLMNMKKLKETFNYNKNNKLSEE